jgi:5'-nucleotidase
LGKNSVGLQQAKKMMKTHRPYILVCNDDGIFAPGLQALIDVASELGDILVVAPDSPQSGMGHAVTINSTIRVNKVSHNGGYLRYSCSGTPVDCIKMAINKLAARPIDLVISGINHGSNSSINVIYSGTMSAAVEGCIEGIPSIGFSLCDYSYDADFDPGKPYVKRIIELTLEDGLPEGVCLNVNIPQIPGPEIRGVMTCRQAKAHWMEEMDERVDPRGGTYYWLTGVFQNQDAGEDTDEWALANNYVSVVPVRIDITAYRAMTHLKKWNFQIHSKHAEEDLGKG